MLHAALALDSSWTAATDRRGPPVAPDLDDTATTLKEALPVLQAVLDHVYFGVAIVNGDWSVPFSNQAALRECADHPALRIEQGRLVLRISRYQAELARALAGARGGRWSLVRLDTEKAQTMLAVMPLWRNSPTVEAPVLLLFGPRSSAKALAIEFYAQSCGLTAAETRVLHALGEGLTPRAIAGRFDVTLSTVRTHLNAIRSRTGARTVIELVRALGSLPPIMRRALGGM